MQGKQILYRINYFFILLTKFMYTIQKYLPHLWIRIINNSSQDSSTKQATLVRSLIFLQTKHFDDFVNIYFNVVKGMSCYSKPNVLLFDFSLSLEHEFLRSDIVRYRFWCCSLFNEIKRNV